MTFTVTYRDSDGARRDKMVDSENRAECLAACRAQGITPLSIREGVCAPRRRAVKSRPALLLLLAVLLIVSVGAVWWFLSRGEEVPQPAETPQRVKRTTPNVKRPERPKQKDEVQTAAVHVVEAPKPVKIDPNARPEKVGETVNGYIKLPSGRLHRVRGVVTNDVAQTMRGKYAIFDYNCDNEIACYLSLKPGDAIFGTMKYNGKFKAEFLKSLETPIVINPDDSEEDKALKRNVRDAKIQLKLAMDNGEDIEQIMTNTRQELQDLARYKLDLTRHLHDMRHEGKLATVEELQDAVDAANKMLEARGIAPMKFGPLVRQKMLMELQKEKEQKQ